MSIEGSHRDSSAANDAAPRGDTAGAGPQGRGVRFYVSCVVVFALTLFVLVWGRAPLTTADTPALLVLSAMGWLSASLIERDNREGVSISFSGVVYMTAVPLVGPAGAGIMAALPYLLDRSSGAIRTVFNAAMTATMAMVGGVAYLAVGGMLPVPVTNDAALLLARVGLPLFVTNIVVSLTNIVLLSVILTLTGGDARRFVTGAMRETLPLYLGYTIICFLFVVLWVPADVGPLSALVVMAPLLVARWIYVQYGDERRAHDRILETLVTASDWGNAAASGHGRRVDAIAMSIGAQLGFGARESRSLHYAAALHDIGRLGLRTSALRKRPSEASEDDFVEIRRHAQIGYDIVKGIAFLEGAAIAIRHHHEHFNGRGYPDGLAGAAIPLLARIVAVSDAFDALTHPLSGRSPMSADDAISVIRARAGTMFDPRVVDALAAAQAGKPWQPTGEAGQPATDQLWWDHDDPAQGDHMSAAARAVLGDQW